MLASATVSRTPAVATAAPATSAEAPYLLEVVNVSKGFPGVIALDDVQLRVRAGTVLALMGRTARASPR